MELAQPAPFSYRHRPLDTIITGLKKLQVALLASDSEHGTTNLALNIIANAVTRSDSLPTPSFPSIALLSGSQPPAALFMRKHSAPWFNCADSIIAIHQSHEQTRLHLLKDEIMPNQCLDLRYDPRCMRYEKSN